MKEGKYLSEAIDYNEIRKGRLNMVVANTGQGKTTMATQFLPQQLKIEDYSRIIYLTDTNMGRDKLLENSDVTQEFPPIEKNKIIVMTYAKFGSLLKQYQIWSSMFDLVIADEFHNLYKYAKVDMAKMFKANPDFSPETLSMMLARESASYKAMEIIKRWSAGESLYVVAMTATPENFLAKDEELNNLISVISAKEKLIAYEIFMRETYTNAEDILVGAAIEGEKRMIFAPNIKLAKEFQKLIENNTDRKTFALWSPSAETPMNNEQYAVRSYLIENESFPDNIDDLFLTEAYSTSWNLKDERVTTTIVHSGNHQIETQFVGRSRQDVPKLYVYDSKAAAGEKRLEQKRNQGMEEEWIIPEQYLNILLDTTARCNLIKEIGFPKKWTSFKKWIEQSPHYLLSKKKIKGNEFFLISKNDTVK